MKVKYNKNTEKWEVHIDKILICDFSFVEDNLRPEKFIILLELVVYKNRGYAVRYQFNYNTIKIGTYDVKYTINLKDLRR